MMLHGVAGAVLAVAVAWPAGARARGQPLGPTVVTQTAAPINLSENPVRGASVTINYTGMPRTVAIYTFTGARVRSFPSPPAGNVVWDLTGDDGRRVVNGVYIVAVDFGGSVARRRIYVARKGP